MGEKSLREAADRQENVGSDLRERDEDTEGEGLKAAIIAVVGSKKSGKTTTIEALTRELVKRGFKVATVKHVSEPDFTIDTKGKDTWRFAQAGARTVILASTNEVATIEKTGLKNLSVDLILRKCEGNDVVLLEGFRKFVGKNESVHKIVVVKSAEEALEAEKSFMPILAFTGPYSTQNLDLRVPYVDAVEKPKKLADIVESVVKKKLR
jgi:molybdopterin-guanine dinucleotide biosynthesis protein B